MPADSVPPPSDITGAWGPPDARGRVRRTRYLIDRRFQLKYTGMLVAVVLGVMVALGAVIWNTASKASVQAQLAVNEAERAMRQSAETSRVTRMNDMMQHADNPELVRTLERELLAVDQEAERNAAQAQQRRAQIEHDRTRLVQLLLGAGFALLVVLSVMGIYITLKIVGPVYKLKRLLRRVGTGRLAVRERLRRGDELEDLFDTFLQMTWSLKALQSARLATLETAIARAEASGVGADVLDELRALRVQMRMGLVRPGDAGSAGSVGTRANDPPVAAAAGGE